MGLGAHFLFLGGDLGGAIDKRRLFELLEPSLAALGYELVDLDHYFGRRGLLRLYIDKDAGVTLTDCEFVSHQIGALLDVEDPLPGSYVLEVSSPGLDRRLRTADHFRRFLDDEVKVELTLPRDGRRHFRGRIRDVGDATLTLDVDGVPWSLGLAEIKTARLVPPK